MVHVGQFLGQKTTSLAMEFILAIVTDMAEQLILQLGVILYCFRNAHFVTLSTENSHYHPLLVAVLSVLENSEDDQVIIRANHSALDKILVKEEWTPREHRSLIGEIRKLIRTQISVKIEGLSTFKILYCSRFSLKK